MVRLTNSQQFNEMSRFISSGGIIESSGTFYVSPSWTKFDGTNNYYFSCFATPQTSGTTTGMASTVLIAGPPRGAERAWSLNILYGCSYFGDTVFLNNSLKIPKNATDGYVLTSDEDGFGTWKPAMGGGATGPTGSSGGPIGPTGSQGIAGSTGPQGLIGSTGLQGIAGPTGSQGLIGPTGQRGSTGSQGIAGPTGSQGLIGPTGSQGSIGPTGSQGSIGPTGLQGSIGPTGSQGLIGPTGLQGIAGPTGLQGSIGPTGSQGLIGPTGLQGIAGVTGSQGLIGPTGSQGLIGPTGLQGIAGPTGSQGLIGPTGSQGSIGPTGSQGLIGPTGSQGSIGPTGLQGIAGPTGSQGSIGPTGSQGLIGPTGLQGIAGVTGPQGSIGPTGSQGLIGPTGLQGIAGVTGSQGLIGPTGLQGSIGPTGLQGSIGPTGSQGISTSYYEYQAITDTTGDPGTGHILWVGGNQNTSPGVLNISHKTDKHIDIDIFLALFKENDILILQDRSNSNNYQKWLITGPITIIPNSYIQVPVTNLENTYIFPNNHSIILAPIISGSQGPTGLPGPSSLADGTASIPSLNFISNSDTGLFRPNNQQLGISAGGNEKLRITPNLFSYYSNNGPIVTKSIKYIVSGETKQLPEIIITWNDSWFYSKIYILVNSYEDNGKIIYSGEWSITGGKRTPGPSSPNLPIAISETQLVPSTNSSLYGFEDIEYPIGNYSIKIIGKSGNLGLPPFSDYLKYVVMVDTIMGQLSNISCNGVITNFDNLP